MNSYPNRPTTRHRYALSLRYCHQLGVSLAVAGWTRDAVIEHMRVTSDRSAGSTTVRRILRAYDEQIARG